MATITLNVRTIVQAIFNTAGEKTNTIYSVAGRSGPNGDLTSSGVAISSQGSNATVLMPMDAQSYPLYLHQMVADMKNLRRHPNQISRVLHFNQNNLSLMAHSLYQETMPNPDYQWQIVTDKNALAVPNQPFIFDSEKTDFNHYTVRGIYQRAKPVRYSGSMYQYCDPLTYGELSDYVPGDSIVMNLRSSTIPNYFRIVYYIYTAETGPSVPEAEIILTFNGLKRTLVAWSVNDSVGVGLDSRTNLAKRKDRFVSSRMR